MGIIETVTAAVCIVAADAAAKTADIQLLEIRLANGLGGKSFVLMEGDVADVEASVAAGVELVTARGALDPPGRDPAAPRADAREDTITWNWHE